MGALGRRGRPVPHAVRSRRDVASRSRQSRRPNCRFTSFPARAAAPTSFPASDFALALKVGEGYGDMRTAEKLGVTTKEVDKLCDAIEKALEKDTLGPGRAPRRRRQGVAQPRAGRREERAHDDAAAGTGAVADRGAHPPRPGERTARSAALQVRALESEPAREADALARRRVHRAGTPLLPLDRPGDAGGVPVVLGAWA